MLEVESKLDYAQVIDLVKLEVPELIPLENPSAEALEELTKTIEAAERVFISDWADDALVGVFTYRMMEQTKPDFRGAYGINIQLQETPFCIVGLSEELLSFPSDEVKVIFALHELCHLGERDHGDWFSARFTDQLLSFYAKKSGGIVSFDAE